MGSALHCLIATVQDSTGAPAASKVTTNTRVSATTGNVSLMSDTLTFPGPSTTGNWLVPNQRVLIGGVPTIGQNSSGQALNAAGSPVPVTVTAGDPRVTGS